jgi:hypothetical protein
MSPKEPQKGFYYHYKHNPEKGIFDYAYEVLNIAHHTEIEGLDESAMVVYRPIYEAPVYKIGKHWDTRPLTMFMEEVVKDGKTIPRFLKIDEPDIIAKLEAQAKQMYQ